jgi:ketosteroid isomerase-like protein
MRHAGTTAAALLLGLAPVAAAQPPVSPETLRDLGDRFDRAQVGQDREALEAMVADDLVFVGSDGARQGRSAFMAGWLDPDMRFEPVTVTDRYFFPLGPDAGIVGGEAVLRGTSGGRAFASRIRFADTFRRVGGQWRAVHIQATRVPSSQ